MLKIVKNCYDHQEILGFLVLCIIRCDDEVGGHVDGGGVLDDWGGWHDDAYVNHGNNDEDDCEHDQIGCE